MTNNNELTYMHKIELNFSKLKENFYKGIREYKNFREICDLLQIEYKKASSDSKIAILKELNRYCLCNRKPNSYKMQIEAIFETPKERIKQTRNKPSIYADCFYPVVIDLLYHNNNIFYSTKYYLFDYLGITNQWYYKFKFISQLDKMLYDEFMHNCFEVANQVLMRGLKNLNKQKKIEFDICYEIYDINDDSLYPKTYYASPPQEKIIIEIINQILDEFNCSSLHKFMESFYFDTLKRRVNILLEEEGIVYKSTALKIYLPDELNVEDEYNRLFGNKSSFEISNIIRESKAIVNERIMAQMDRNNKYEANRDYNLNTNYRSIEYIKTKEEIQEQILKKLQNDELNELLKSPNEAKIPPYIMISTKKIETYYYKVRTEFTQKIVKLK